MFGNSCKEVSDPVFLRGRVGPMSHILTICASDHSNNYITVTRQLIYNWLLRFSTRRRFGAKQNLSIKCNTYCKHKITIIMSNMCTMTFYTPVTNDPQLTG